MSTKLELNEKIPSNLVEKKVPRTPNSHFTFTQTIGLLLITLIVSVGGWYMIGEKYIWSDIDLQRVNEQLKYYQQKVAAEPKNIENRISLGYTYYLKGDNDKALSEFKQAQSISEKDGKKNFDVYYNMGLIYLDKSQYDNALEMFEQTVQISPRDYKGHLQKGIAYRGLKMYKESIDTLQKASKLMPGNADIIYQIGKTAEEQGDKAAAIDIYKEALSFDPLYKDAVNGLKRLQGK